MFSTQIERLADVIIENKLSKTNDREIIIYGLTTGIEIIFNIFTTMILGFIFGLVFESLVFLIAFSMIRTYAGGYHCVKAINCYLFSSTIVILVLSIVKFTPDKYIFIISVILLILSLPILLKFMPVDTKTKSLDADEKKYFRKKAVTNLLIEIVIIIALFYISEYSLGYVVSLSIMVTAFLIVLGKIDNAL